MRKNLRGLRKSTRNALVGAAAVLMGFGGVAATALPAHAATPMVHTDVNGGSVPMFWGTTQDSGVKAWLPNDTGFTPICYEDNGWYPGNYNSNRWFYGSSNATGDVGNVPASYVVNQEAHPVGAC